MRPADIASIYLLLILALLAPTAHSQTANATTCQPPTWTSNPDTMMKLTAALVLSNDSETSVFDLPHPNYQAKYDELWSQGWRVKVLRARVSSGNQTLYTAVWRQTGEYEAQYYGLEFAAFKAKYDELSGKNLGMEFLTQYVVGDAVYYSAIWRPVPANTSEMQDFKAKYDQLYLQGWRLHILETYVHKAQILYSATWRTSTVDENQVFSVNHTVPIPPPRAALPFAFRRRR
ncbi:hypothetical protein BC938DRAFT_475490 [Jimgerdemannia flammicorona]|uniref:NIPSNAP domain-containing protein n=1 Tax=Jimgerdemannia flammicorona TaxID=994334 RepID=A0A433QRI4_9FUNG|nr:hypothetical protein BC938DRAFT_475490 [Jimgerdemannia flammicorona]